MVCSARIPNALLLLPTLSMCLLLQRPPSLLPTLPLPLQFMATSDAINRIHYHAAHTPNSKAPELLGSLNTVPQALIDAGYEFRDPDVTSVLAAGLAQSS